jgi:hypothetical protein
MSEFFPVGYRGKELEALNVVQRYQNLLHVSDIVKCDGHTINEFIISDFSELFTRHIFPQEEPSNSDVQLWKAAVKRLCSGSINIPYTLGAFVQELHLPWKWFTMGIASKLYRLSKNGDREEGKYHIYRRHLGSVETRHGARFDWIGPELGLHEGTHKASVTMCSDTCAIMHSKTPRPQETVPLASFLEVPLLYGNPGLWENLSFDDDGEWIWQSVEQGSLVIAHNGSYMPKESTEHCLAGVIMYCSTLKKWLKSSIVEHSNAASNYRGELLGAVMAFLILRAATEKSCHPYPRQTLYCDNRGVIQHSNTPRIGLTEKQKQDDLIRYVLP